MKHEGGLSCPSCMEKLEEGHRELSRIYSLIKSRFQDCHIAWCFRGEADQNKAFQEGQSKKRWPNSAHNRTVNGEPRSLAVDVFRLGKDGKAHFEVDYYRSIWDFLKSGNEGVFWGGNFPTFKDYDHFQLSLDLE